MLDLHWYDFRKEGICAIFKRMDMRHQLKGMISNKLRYGRFSGQKIVGMIAVLSFDCVIQVIVYLSKKLLARLLDRVALSRKA